MEYYEDPNTRNLELEDLNFRYIKYEVLSFYSSDDALKKINDEIEARNNKLQDMIDIVKRNMISPLSMSYSDGEELINYLDGVK